jgi:DNA-binding NarL/FixJ family response regulator
MVIFVARDPVLDTFATSRCTGLMRKPSGVPPELVVELVDDDLAVFSWRLEPELDGPELTAAERDVLRQVTAGASNEQIARARSTSARTVANQVASLLRKLGARSRYDLIRRFGAQRDGRGS